MTAPKIKPCPKCGDADVVIYTYDNGWRHVECDQCLYLGPGAGNKLDAIRQHNALTTQPEPTRGQSDAEL